MIIFTKATVPDHLGRLWLQHLRDFDHANPGCHFEVLGDAPDMTLAEIVEALQLDPGLDLQKLFKIRPQ